MSKGNTFENEVLALIFNATAIADLAENDATSPLTQLHVALHTADPGEAGAQNASEANYTGYARVAVNRNSGGWTVSGNNVSNAGAVTFGACTAGSNTITHFSVGVASSGATKILYKGVLGSVLGPFRGNATDDVVTIEAHGLSVDDRVAFYAGPNGALPTGVAEGTVYWVKTVPSADTITISATQGGATLDITADGDGAAYKVVPLAVSAGITPQFAAGELDIYED